MSAKVADESRPSPWSPADPWSEVKSSPGAFPSSPNPDGEWELTENQSISAAVKARRNEYIRRKTIKLKVGTWNVASMSDTQRDLAGWFVQGKGAKGLSQDLSGLSVEDDCSSSDSEIIESVDSQEEHHRRKSSTLPRHDEPAVASENEVDLYVLGLQEVIDISSVTEAIRPYYDPNPSKRWKTAVRRALPAGYKKIAEVQLLGLLLLVFGSSSVAREVSSVDCQSVGTGFMGYVGNKGAVAARLVLGGTTRLLFVNCHLAAGADNAALTRRIWDTQQILSRMRFGPAIIDGDKSSDSLEEIGVEDFAFWFGDLNYRLDDIPGNDVRRLLLLHTRNEYDVQNKSRRKIDSELGYIEAPVSETSLDNTPEDKAVIENSALLSTAEPPLDPKHDPASLHTTMQSLLAHDQLKAQQRLGKAFHDGWREGDINFLPTYKYDVGSVAMFDSGEKKRSPSWCDRILYRTRRDRETYLERTKLQAEARKKDAEMTARGLESDAAEQEVLFDYDPTTDAADDYDEDEDAEGTAQDVQRVVTKEGFEDVIVLEDYISHQRVLSSDHKPLSAVFQMTYDAIDTELRGKILQETTRQSDKTENEARPSVTVVVENSPGGSAPADKRTGATELNDVDFGAVRYQVPAQQPITIANTGPIEVTFALVSRPTTDGSQPQPSPDWLNIFVHHAADDASARDQELGGSARFTLQPGDIAPVDLVLEVKEHPLVHKLNQGIALLDDILILRVLHGRDYFIRVKGTWVGTCFGRSLDELARVPAGVRSLPDPKNLDGGTDVHHSAPQELYKLTDALVRAVERATADWAMVNQSETPPWLVDQSWPFSTFLPVHQSAGMRQKLASIREALDHGEGLEDMMPMADSSSLERVELLTAILLDFLEALPEGIVSATIWDGIEQDLRAFEKSRSSSEDSNVQDMVLEHLSSRPVHSVSFSFITFMLTRIVNELTANALEVTTTPTITPNISRPVSRSRSSTQFSEADSDASPALGEPARLKIGFLPNLIRRRPDSRASTGSPITPASPADRRKALVKAFSERLAHVVIRAERENDLKGKDKKVLDGRKRRVLEIFMNNRPF